MILRPAKKTDAHEAARLIHFAIKDIAEKLTGEKKETIIQQELAELFTLEQNRLSYQNASVMIADGKLAGMFIAYSGDDAEMLDSLILDRVIKKTGETDISFDKEADKSDYYLDTLSVHPDFQRRGIGSLLLQYFEKIAIQRGFNTISLNVAQDNPKAKELYVKLGYQKKKAITINDHRYDYMVKNLRSSKSISF